MSMKILGTEPAWLLPNFCFFSFLTNKICTVSVFFFLVAGLTCNTFAQSPPLDLSDLSLEELMKLDVVTASRRPQPLAQTAAAVFVISNEDIKQSGATTIADVLRLAPGVQVARINAHTWAVSIRGFNDRFSNKLLVLMDGRPLYNPLHSGVTWEVQDMVLEDLERIEIVRGPGASMWGANAVNGVINIITKNSSETLGALLTASAGTSERFHGQARYGGTMGETDTYRLYAKYHDRAAGENTTPFSGDDDWNMSQGGFRADHAASANNRLTLQGDLYTATLNDVSFIVRPSQPIAVPTRSAWDMQGYHVLGKWRRTIADSNNLQVRLYYDTTTTDSLFGTEDRATSDFDFQHVFPVGDNQLITWGIGYRFSSDDIRSTYQISTRYHDSLNESLYSGFVQDEIRLFLPSWKLIVGSKFEHNEYTGFEIQPSIRTSWLPTDNQSLWLALSRAVRTPSRFEYDGLVRSPLVSDPQTGTMTTKVWQSNTDFDSEILTAYEAGYRHIANKKLSFDLALFYNDYDQLKTAKKISSSTTTTSFGEILVETYTPDNKMEGYTWGGELVIDFLPGDWWRIQGVYSYLQMQLENHDDSSDTSSTVIENTSPRSQFSVRSYMELAHNLSLNLWLRYVGSLASENTDSYWDGDIRLAWQPVHHLELSLVGQNLLHDSHKEIEQLFYFSRPTEVPRSVYLKLSWNY